MKAIATDGQGRVWLADAPMPTTGPYDCLVKMRSCLFCNSTDQHIVEGSFDFGIPYPALLGHESLGQVVECGSKVRNFQVGDWVTRAYAIYPDETNAGLGSGWAGFAEFGKIRDHAAEREDTGTEAPGFFKYMQKLPPELDPGKAELLICQKELFSATRKLGDLSGRSFLIAGAGVAGLLFAVFLKLGGATRVAVAARRREALDLVRKLTPADETILIGGKSAATERFGELIDTTGSIAALHSIAVDWLAPGGPIHSYAIYSEMSRPNFASLLPDGHPHARLDPDEASAHEEVCALLSSGNITSQDWIAKRFSLAEFEQAWALVKSKSGLKIAIDFGD